MVFFLILTGLATLVFARYFEPSLITHTSLLKDGRILVERNAEEFPYFGNVFGREGFYPDNLDGNKYHYIGFFNLFRMYQIVGYMTVIVLSAYILSLFIFLKRDELFSLEFILLVINLGMLLLLPKIYDRYLLPLFPIFILFCLRLKQFVNFSKLEKLILAGFVAAFIFLGYQYSMDFVLTHKYVWDSATRLVNENVSPNKIRAGHAWGMLYPNETRRWDYSFEYVGTEKQTPGDTTFEFVSKTKIDFPFSIYIDPYIYLYHRK